MEPNDSCYLYDKHQTIILHWYSKILGATNILPGDGKIIGGQDANIKDFPHQISMRFIDTETMDFYHVCGGSILNAKTILTAAHCTDG